MSYKDYLNDFGSEKVQEFKEKIVKSKEFSEAFLDTTSHVIDNEKKINMFDSVVNSMCEVLGVQLVEQEPKTDFGKKISGAGAEDMEKPYEQPPEYEDREKKEEPDMNPLTGKPDYSQAEQELIDVIVKAFDGYDYSVKHETGNIMVIFNIDHANAPFVNKWAEVFPHNEFKGIKMQVEFDSI